eukprot:6312292-Amphidinium_carterae.1
MSFTHAASRRVKNIFSIRCFASHYPPLVEECCARHEFVPNRALQEEGKLLLIPVRCVRARIQSTALLDKRG